MIPDWHAYCNIEKTAIDSRNQTMTIAALQVERFFDPVTRTVSYLVLDKDRLRCALNVA